MCKVVNYTGRQPEIFIGAIASRKADMAPGLRCFQGHRWWARSRSGVAGIDQKGVVPWHEQQGRQVSCIGDERRNNPLFCGVSRDEFIARLASRPHTLSPNSSDIAAANRNSGLSFPESIPPSLP